MVVEATPDYPSQWAAIESVATKIGVSHETLCQWVRQAEVEGGQRPGLSTEDAAEIKRLKKELAELRSANEILKAAAAFFGAELDRPALMRWRSMPGGEAGVDAAGRSQRQALNTDIRVWINTWTKLAPIRLNQDRRPDPRQHRPLLHTNQRFTTPSAFARTPVASASTSSL
jgi:transposase